MTARERIESMWYGRNSPPGFARAAARLYGTLMTWRRTLYRRGLLAARTLPVPVIVVGNIAVGGTGKTPLTLWLAEALQAAGRTPGIACRAYAASSRTPARVRDTDDPTAMGDEAVLMAMRASCPVWSGPQRGRAAAAMLTAHPEIDLVLCDDGLQHYALSRNVELAVVDAARGFGNGRLLPAGPLREPIARLAQVDAIVVNGEATVYGLPPGVPRYAMRLMGDIAVRVGDTSQSQPAQALRGTRVAAVAGIGHPDRFFRHLEALGIDFEPHPFPDHHRYTEEELRRIEADYVLMTEKDAIKCRAFRDDRLWTLPVSAQVDAALIDQLLECIGKDTRRARPHDATQND